MNSDEKLGELLLLLVKQRTNALQLLKNYLVQYSPEPELVEEIKQMIESQMIMFENEAFDFVEKFGDYKKSLKKSILIQEKESMNANFLATMAKNFPEGIK